MICSGRSINSKTKNNQEQKVIILQIDEGKKKDMIHSSRHILLPFNAWKEKENRILYSFGKGQSGWPISRSVEGWPDMTENGESRESIGRYQQCLGVSTSTTPTTNYHRRPLLQTTDCNTADDICSRLGCYTSTTIHGPHRS
mmetsp:Transcript_2781/g.6072  ORF Transcript_2781/g.6072 Transcript_2781/m.6072 type:complete len:142 (+) Transcript_2781:968-1393(+)